MIFVRVCSESFEATAAATSAAVAATPPPGNKPPTTTSLSEFEVLKILIEQTCFDGNALYFIYHTPSDWDSYLDSNTESDTDSDRE